MFTALVAIDARITYLGLDASGMFQPRTASAAELTAAVVKDAKLADNIVLVSYHLPLGGARDSVLAQKVALREVNAHSIVNSTSRFRFAPKLVIQDAALVFGGIAPFPWRATETEREMNGKKLGLDLVGPLTKILEKETRAELKRWAARWAEAPNEGFTVDYKVQLVLGFFYKAIVNAMLKQGAPVPPEVASAGLILWGNWPASDGRQYYVTEDWKEPVGQPYIKSTAMYQTSGQLHYTQELPVPPLAVNGAFVQSGRALANFRFVLPGSDRAVKATVLRDHLSEYADTSSLPK